MKKSNINIKKAECERLMKASNTPDVRDKDKGINKWVLFLGLVFFAVIWYSIRELINLI